MIFDPSDSPRRTFQAKPGPLDPSDLLSRLISLLEPARGPENGLTLDWIAVALGICRRTTEHLIQEHLRDIPFVVVADEHGYYRPTSAAQINAYRHSLRRRHVPLVTREEITDLKATTDGWPLVNGEFVDPPEAPADLFAFARDRSAPSDKSKSRVFP